MIVPMKKAGVIVQAKDTRSAMAVLRSLGVIHLEHQQTPQGKDIATLKDDIALLDRVIAILESPAYFGKSGLRDLLGIEDWRFPAKQIVDTFARIDQLEEYSRSLSALIAEWQAWGDFDPASVASLGKKGVLVRLYQIPVRDLETLPRDIIVKRIAVSKGVAWCACVCRAPEGSRPVELPYKEIMPPRMGLTEMRLRLTENGDTIAALKDMMRKFTCYHERFVRIRQAFLRELEFHEALHGMGQTAKGLAYLAGYIPRDAEKTLRDAARSERWALSVTDPGPDDAVPTLIRNPRWVSLITPVFKLIEIVPGYRELDISPIFLLFLTLFFGMIIGDAGYGALYILMTALAQRKWGRGAKDKRVFFLFYLFNASAILWGVATGTFFGQAWLLESGCRPLVPALTDTKSLQAFCFLIGAVHLTIAQGWQAVRKLPSLTALADAGWVSIIWAAYFLARLLILGDALPAATRWLIVAGAVFVVIGTNPQRNILKMAGSGLGAVALNIMNNFTDVVSYIRLFAVGLAGVAIADTVNTLAAESGNAYVGTLIVFAGHTINMILGPMSVLVHGIRLNVLEFSGHAGLTWTGTAYKPLKE